MSTDSIDADSIGPQLDLEDLRLPADVGEHLADLYGRDGRIETGAAWVATMRSVSDDVQGEPPTEDDLCTAPDGNHSVTIGDWRQSYVCVLDPLAVPFLRNLPGTVRSRTPEAGEPVEIEIGTETATATPDDAVISIGVARDVDPDADVTIERTYTETCPYIHAFTSVEEYEEWTDSVDAATTAVPVDEGVAIARELAATLFE